MNTLKQLIFTFAVVIGLSIAVSAQKDDQRRPPPKDPPPTVNPPREKPPPQKPPGDEKKPKKPEMAFAILLRNETSDLV